MPINTYPTWQTWLEYQPWGDFPVLTDWMNDGYYRPGND